MNKKQIKDLALSNGFRLKEQPSGEMELNPYVYDFADALLTKANERVNRLEKILQRYESEQLQPLKLRVRELENAILDACSTYHFEPDLSQPTSLLKELLEINSKWVLDQEISSDAARFALEQNIEVLQELADEDESGTRHVYYLALSKIEQLRKEQEL